MDPLSPDNINPSWSVNSSSTHPHPMPISSPSSSSFRDSKIFGAPGLGLVSSPATSSGPETDVSQVNGGAEREREKIGPFLKVRIGGLERNRKDLLIRFDASVSRIHSSL